MPVKESLIARIINLIPHGVTIVDSEGHVCLEYPSEGSARIVSSSEDSSAVNGIGISQCTFQRVEGLPEPQEGILYLVSMPVAQICRARTDLICPDTGVTALRSEDKKVIGVRGFVVYSGF